MAHKLFLATIVCLLTIHARFHDFFYSSHNHNRNNMKALLLNRYVTRNHSATLFDTHSEWWKMMNQCKHCEESDRRKVCHHSSLIFHLLLCATHINGYYGNGLGTMFCVWQDEVRAVCCGCSVNCNRHWSMNMFGSFFHFLLFTHISILAFFSSSPNR